MPTGVRYNLPDVGKMRGIYKLCEVDAQYKAGEDFFTVSYLFMLM